MVDEEGRRVERDGTVYDENGEVVNRVDPLVGGQIILPVPEWVTQRTGASDVVINKSAMNVIFQGEPWFLPGPGPLVAIPTNQILVDIAKKDGPLLADTFWAQYLTGGMGVTDDNMLEQAAPQWAKNIASAVRQDREEPRFSQARSEERRVGKECR